MSNNQITTMLKVLIVDDHPAIREAIFLKISRQPDLVVCGEAEDTIEALRLVENTKPDMAIVDISLKNGFGIDLVKRIRDRDDHIRMLVWSTHNESLYAERALKAGAQGFISKDQATDKIIVAIRRVLEGNIYLSETMSQKILHRTVSPRQNFTNTPIELLANRELQVFRKIGEGNTTSQIAEQLHLSIKTVETYRNRIRDKLELKNGTELSNYATRWMIQNE